MSASKRLRPISYRVDEDARALFYTDLKDYWQFAGIVWIKISSEPSKENGLVIKSEEDITSIRSCILP